MTSSSVVRTGQLFTDRVMAGLHELDRQEIEYFTDWQRKDKARRRRAIKRRRDAKQRHESISRHTTGLCHFWNRIPDILPEESYSQLNESSDDSDDDAQSHSHSPVEDQEHEDRDRFLFENHLWSNRLQQTSDDSDTDSAYDPSDDETVLFRMVETFDYPQSQLQGQLYPQKSATETVITTPSFPLAGTLARLRRKQATKESRQQRMYLCRSNGLPKALPLSTCGQWIQVINLHQETPYPHRTNPQSLTHASSPDSQSQRRRRRTSLSVAQNQFSAGEPPVQPPIFQGPPGTQNPAPQQQTDRQSFLASLFGWNLVQRPQQQQQQQQQQIGQTEPLEHFEHHNLDWTEPPRLRSRRDYITDNTLATVLDHCPRLCRLLISECHGITDHGLALIRNAECVRRGTLVSLHMAGCDKITDRGLLTLATGHHDWNKNMALKEPLESRAGEADITLKLESLDMAGCFQISDRGLIPLIKACGRHLEHLRVSECDLVTARSVFALAEHCPHIKWLDLARSGPLTDNCLTSLAQRCLGLEWLNLARQHPSDIDADIDAEVDVHASGNMALQGSDTNGYGYDDDGYGDYGYDDNNTQDKNTQRTRPDIISDKAIALICELCPQLQLLDLSYIVSLTNNAIESLAQTAHALVCLTIIGCPNITSHSLVYLAKLRNTSGCLGCITMGDAQGISERDIEQIMQGTLSGWQKSLVDETNLGEILGRSWDE
ncbi:hypothetical protein BGZ94_004206 [Podila epigama]|nr:hypothetical protein BGZ94_004206 [Podila epigama]